MTLANVTFAMLIVVASSVVSTGCRTFARDDSDTIAVFAAASLTDVFTELGSLFERRNNDVDVTMNFAGSQALATQLSQGAQADVFASANELQMDVAREHGVINGVSEILAFNRLTVIVPESNPAEVSSVEDLARPGVKLILASESVPVGRYSREMLDNLSDADAYGSDFRTRVESNIVSTESNVRQVTAKVQLGEADAGIVYVTDITANVEEDVIEIEIPIEFNVLAAYPIAAVNGGDAELATAFIKFVLSADGQEVLAQFGFVTVQQ